MEREYQICTRCIMDTTDPDIVFDDQGVCNHCKEYDAVARDHLLLGEQGKQELERVVSKIKQEGKNKEYDCIIGVSGGVDSTYVAYTVKNLGLRPLAVHLDNGWDSELAVSNVEKVLNVLDIDLHTCVLDWEEFKDLQVAFLKASTTDSEVPTDHAIVAVLFQMAVQQDLRYVISGGNHVSEGILPISWSYGSSDWRYIRSIQNKFGTRKLRTYPHFSLTDMMNYILVRRIRSFRILNHVPYNRDEAMKILQQEVGWKYYGAKHYESIYTRFFQGYILPRKFNIDKRKAHLSTLICAGQITQEEALKAMEDNPYTEDIQEDDKQYVIKKLGLTEEEFEQIMNSPIKRFTDYPTYYNLLTKLRPAIRFGKRMGVLSRQNTAW